MANQINLKQHTFSLAEIAARYPAKAEKRRLIFQAELRSLAKGDAKFGIILYPSWRKKGKWIVGEKITGNETGADKLQTFNGALGFANNEVPLDLSRKQARHAGKKKAKQLRKFSKLFAQLISSKELCDRAKITCDVSISDNPHLSYDLTLEGDGSSATLSANPSPPARPVS